MTTEEKIKMRRILTDIWYNGDVDGGITKLCRLAGWKSSLSEDKIRDDQANEIEYYIASRV